MTATVAFNRWPTEDAQQLTNFAAKLTIGKDETWAEASSVKGGALGEKVIDLLVSWIGRTLPNVSYRRYIDPDPYSDPACSVLEQGHPDQRSLFEVLIAFSPQKGAIRDVLGEDFWSSAKIEFRPLLTMLEILGCTTFRPEVYLIRGSDIVLEYTFENARTSIVNSNSYCHVMSCAGAEITDKFFTNEDYTPRTVAKYTAQELETNSKR